MPALVERVLRAYPMIYLACHRRHVQDPQSGAKLTAALAGLLDHLDPKEPTSVVKLAQHMGVTPATVSVALNRLADKGYIRRVRDRKDQRRVLVTLTAAGERVTKANSVLEPRLIDAVLSRLPEKERNRAVDGLEVLARAAGAVLNSRSREGSWVRRRSQRKREQL